MIRTFHNGRDYASKLTFGSRVYQKTSKIFLQTVPIIPSQKKYNFTLCHDKKFLWFRVAKVGSTTIRDVFIRNNIKLDAQSFSCHYPVGLNNHYFKFAMVRNPWDRLVSCWKNKVLEKNGFKFFEKKYLEMKNFKNFVEYVSRLDIKKCDAHIRLQSELIDLNNIDYLGRFENFNSDLAEVMRRLKLGEMKIERKNVSNTRKNYKEYYDDELIEKVAKIYRKDIMIFNYNF